MPMGSNYERQLLGRYKSDGYATEPDPKKEDKPKKNG